MKKVLYWFGVIMMVVSFTACEEDRPQSEIDEEKIQKYIKDNNLDATRDPYGNYYIIHDEGTDKHPTYYSSLKVNYSGYFLNGTVFDSGTLTDFPLANAISGWQACIPLLGQGGSGTFIIPSGMGYGAYGQGEIPGNEILVFDVTLIDFK